MFKLIIKLLLLFMLINQSQGYEFDASAKITINESLALNDKNQRSILQIKGLFTDSNGDYGNLNCIGTNEINPENTLLNLTCQGNNQINEFFWIEINRIINNDDASIGKTKYIKGTGKYINYIGRQCNYAVKYFEKSKVFYKHKC